VFTLAERLELVRGCKWATEVVPGAPYTCDPTWLDRYNCEVSVHGDDIVMNADGEDCYTVMRKQGRFATVPRTKSISTTNLIGRMLRLPIAAEKFPNEASKPSSSTQELQTYVPSTRRIAQFANSKEPKPGDRFVYVDGSFDLLHAGHASFLKKAKALGDYLIVGVHTDEEVASRTMPGMPIMTLQERVLNVLAMRYVDDVIIGAPYVLSNEFLDQIQPAIVVAGESESTKTRTEAGCFRVPQEKGIFQTVKSDFPDLTALSAEPLSLEPSLEFCEFLPNLPTVLVSVVVVVFIIPAPNSLSFDEELPNLL